MIAVEQGLLPRTPVVGRVERWTIGDRMQAYTVPGVSVAVFSGGRLAWAKGYGVCQAGDPERPVTPTTLFQAASMSKPVCATAALQLVAEGMIGLDEPANRYLASWQLPDNDFTRRRPVTLRHILSHTAGLNVHGFEGFEQGDMLPSVQEILRGDGAAKTAPVMAVHEPGSRYQYSGGGTTIAQLLVMELHGQPFDRAVRERIFAPLEIRDATFAQPLGNDLAGRAASGHRAGPVVLPGRWRNLPQLGAGGLWCTPAAYAQFLIGLSEAYQGKSDTLLPRDLAAEMMRRQGPGPFGLGPRVFGEGEALRIEHGGSQQGYQCESVCYPATGDGAVVMTNSDLGSPLAFEILNAVASVYGWPSFLRSPRNIRPAAVSDLDRYVGTYRITSGMEAEFIGIRRDGDMLFALMDQVPDTPVFVGEDGQLFSPLTPYDVKVEFGPGGQVGSVAVHEEDLVILTADRDETMAGWRPTRRGG